MRKIPVPQIKPGAFAAFVRIAPEKVDMLIRYIVLLRVEAGDGKCLQANQKYPGYDG